MEQNLQNSTEKKPWVTPKIVLISKGSVEGGGGNSDREANYWFHASQNHYHKTPGTSSSTYLSPGEYNNLSS
jgi:hypothetical protein